MFIDIKFYSVFFFLKKRFKVQFDKVLNCTTEDDCSILKH